MDFHGLEVEGKRAAAGHVSGRRGRLVPILSAWWMGGGIGELWRVRFTPWSLAAFPWLALRACMGRGAVDGAMASPGGTTRRKKSLAKLIEQYYADLEGFKRQHVLFEMGTRQAFHRLMADAGKEHKWTLIAEQEKKVGGKTIRTDGTR